jgi:hypothetical protein
MRLSHTLGFAAEYSHWHAGRLAGLDLEAISPDDLTSLPTMTKADVMNSWDRIVTDPRLTLDGARRHLAQVDDTGRPFLLDEYFAFTTGGSTGEPAVFVWSLNEFARWGASTIRLVVDAGDPPAQRLTFVAARCLRHPSAWPPLIFHGRSVGSRQCVSIDQPVSAIVERLNAIDPDSLWVVSSMLPALPTPCPSGSCRCLGDGYLNGSCELC